MRVNAINTLNTNFKKLSFNRLTTMPLSKDTFELQNKDSISFGKKKSKEKADKNKIYKQLRKAGCGEKDANSIINNEKRFKHLLFLIENAKDFEREITLKEMAAIVSNEFDEEQTKRFIFISGDNAPASRKLSQKEAVSVVKNNVDNTKLQRFIDLKDTDEEGNALLSRPLTNSEACLMCNENFDDIQAQTYLRLKDVISYFRIIDFISDKNQVERFIELTSTNEEGQALLSRVPTDKEALSLTLDKLDNNQAQRVIDLIDNNSNLSRSLSYKEAQSVVVGELEENDIQEFINIKNHLTQRNEKRPYHHILSDEGIVLTVKQKFDKQKINIFYELSNRFFEADAIAIVTDDEKYSRLVRLSDPQDKRRLTLSEAASAIRNNLSDTDVEIYKELTGAKLQSYQALDFIKNKDNTEKYLQFTTEEKTPLSRKLTPDEAHLAITKEYNNRQTQEFINIKDSNPNLEHNYITILIDFIDYKDKKNISKLSFKEKRNLLKLLVKHNASLFNTNISEATYPLVPKNQEEYCKVLPKLAKAIGINTNLLSEENKTKFFAGIEGLISAIQSNSELTSHLDSIYAELPELKDKKSENTINTLKNITQNPQFKQLTQEDKNILAIATILKDISSNPEEASFDAFYILQKFNLPEDKQLKIYELIKTSNWSEKLSNSQKEDVEKIAQDIAFETRHSNTFELSKILCEAILKTSGSIQSLGEMKSYAEKIDAYLKNLQETQIFLPQTRIPKASKMTNCEVLSANDITNTVLYINKTDKELSNYGFEDGTTLKNWQGLVHGLDTEQQLHIFTTFSLIDSEALLSSSYMNPREYKVFKKQGLILDVNPNDIHAGYFKDFGSGFKKDIEDLKRNYLFRDKQKEPRFERNKHHYRTYIPNLIKRHLNYSDNDYLRAIKEIKDCKSITDVERKNKKFAQALLEIFESIHFGERKYNRKYNEILISRPKIQGVFAYGQKYEQIPIFLRQFAQDNDLPIIIFG